MRFGTAQVPRLFYFIALLYLMYTLMFTSNFLLTIPIVLFPILAFKLLWVKGQHNVLFWGIMMQWLSISTQLLYSNFLGITIEERGEEDKFPGYMMDDATLFSIIGLFAFTLGVYFAVKKINNKSIDDCIDNYDPKKILLLYALISITVFLSSALIWSFPAIVQYVFFFFYLKWGFFIVTFIIIQKRKLLLKNLLYAIVGLEIMLSFASFFAGNFINVVGFLVLGIITLQPKLNIRASLILLISFVGLLHIFIIWTAIKNEYRTFVKAGQNTQTVVVSRAEAVDKLWSLATNVNDGQYQDGLVKLVDRIGYIQYFAATLDYVPNKTPHQNGDIYLAAIQHYLVPRFINPDKKALDDSKHTQQFTGIGVSGVESATSFSLGYIADAYIDLGEIYMHVLLFAFGTLFGFFYKQLYNKSANELWSWIVVIPFFLLLNINGKDTAKALGALLVYSITVLLLRNILYKFLDPLIRKKN